MAGLTPGLDRRSFLSSAAGAATSCLVAPFTVWGQDVAASTMSLGNGFTVTAGLGGNIVVLATPDGAVVVDTGALQYTNELGSIIGTQTGGADVTTVFNTHWHLDQVGGNALLREQGARLIAHAKTAAHLNTPYYLPEEDRYQAPLPPEAQPTESFFATGSLDVGGQRIDYGYLLEAHTDGDIYIHFSDRNIIAVGDAISPERDPVFDWYGGGWLGGRIDSLALLLELSDRETRFVPSYGPVTDRAYVESEHTLMIGLYDILFDRIRAGESAADILASGALDRLPRRFDNPGKLLYDMHKSMWAHYNTLSHDIV